MQIKKMIITMLMLFGTLDSLTTIEAQSNAQGGGLGLTQRCGTQLSDAPVSGGIWVARLGSPLEATKAQSIISNTQKIAVKNLSNGSSDGGLGYSPRATHDGHTIISMVAGPQNKYGSQYLQVKTDNGISPLLLPIDESQYIWNTIGTEREPGHFPVLAYDQSRSAVLLDLSWTSTALITKPVTALSFSIPNPPTYGPNKWRAEISTDWNIIAYSDTNVDYNMNFYSVRQQKVIASFPFNVVTSPQIIWLQNNTNIGLIIPSGLNAGPIYRIDKEGNVNKVLDLSTINGGQQVDVGIDSSVSSNNQVLLAVAILSLKGATTGYHYVLLDLNTYQAIDMCLTGDGVYYSNISGYPWSSDGRYITVIEGINEQKPGLLILDVTTGNYFRIVFNDPNIVPFSWIQSSVTLTPSPTG